MKKKIILLLIIISVCLICGCVSQSQSVPQKSVVTPKPTPKTQFNLNEPATDGNIRITVIRSSNYADSSKSLFSPNTKWVIKSIYLKIENLRSDKVIHLLSTDFTLIDKNNKEYSNGNFEGHDKFDIDPNQWEQVWLNFNFPENTDLSTFNKLKFDFSGSGGNSGSPIVYFNL